MKAYSMNTIRRSICLFLSVLILGNGGSMSWAADRAPQDVLGATARKSVTPTEGNSLRTGQPNRKIAAVDPTPHSFQASEAYGKLPLSFEANHGQAGDPVKFLARGDGYTLFLNRTEAVLAMNTPPERGSQKGRSTAIRMRLLGANAKPEVHGLDRLHGRSNYFQGNDPKNWLTDIPHYARVEYQEVYPGVNMIYYGNQRELEYDLVVAPGVDPSIIRLRFDGIKRVRMSPEGDLMLITAAGEIRQHKPKVYQQIDNDRKPIESRYVMKGRRTVGFEVAKYDVRQPLIIDPILRYATYIGGNNPSPDGCDPTSGGGIAVDSLGNAYITGSAANRNFPTTEGAYLRTGAGAFVTKFNPDGTELIYSTYLSSGGLGTAIRIDSLGNAYLTGWANSEFPTTANAFQRTWGGGSSDAFITVLNADGNGFLYSTYLGGSSLDHGNGIALDDSGDIFVTGNTLSTNFPVTAGAFQRTYGGSDAGNVGDAFVARIDPSRSGSESLIYSTYLGGSRAEQGARIALDIFGYAYVAGYTRSADFPVTPGALQTSLVSGQSKGFVAKFDTLASGPLSRVYATYLGGSGPFTEARGIAVNKLGNAYITGYTDSSDFPMTTGAFQATYQGGTDAFVTQLNGVGTNVVASTYLGGSGQDIGGAIVLDSSDNVYITGSTGSNNFPVTPGAIQASRRGAANVFVTKLNGSLRGPLLLSTYLGGGNRGFCERVCPDESGNGIAVDDDGNIYLTGSTAYLDFPVTARAFQRTLHRSGCVFYGQAAFVAKITDSTQCNISLPITRQQFDFAADDGSFDVVADDGCGWHAVSNAPWITITDNDWGLGNDTVNYSVSENIDSAQRTGTITISSAVTRTFTVVQGGRVCTYTLDPENASFPTQGGDGAVTVTVLAGCNWTAAVFPDSRGWITITSGSSGSGTGEVTYTVAPNEGQARAGRLLIAGQVFTVTQAGM